VQSAVDGLGSLLTHDDTQPRRSELAVDQGTGVANRPVVGLLFWVRADDVGQAASTAVATARRACSAWRAGNAELYDVTVIPRRAVAGPDASYPPMPD
jgi:hypothetical protein